METGISIGCSSRNSICAALLLSGLLGLGLAACAGKGSSAGGSSSGTTGSTSGGESSSAGAANVHYVNITGGKTNFVNPLDVAVDGSGNVWVTESGVFVVGAEIQAVSSSASITELVQAAVPVTTPLL